MKPKKLALELCRREGKSKQVNIAQMSETVGHLADLVGTMNLGEKLELSLNLEQHYLKREKKKKAAKKKRAKAK